MILFSHPTGNANVRQALRAFRDAAVLDEFVTTLAVFRGGWLGRLAHTRLGSDLKRRRYDDDLADITQLQPVFEWCRLLAQKLKQNWLTKHERGIFSIDQVCRRLDRFAARRVRAGAAKLRSVYCYEDAAVETFREAKRHGKICFYDLPIGYWREGRQIQQEEAELNPDWASTMPALIDSEEKLLRKDEELRLADHVIVATAFTARTLQAAPFSIPPPVVIPYGSPLGEARRDDDGEARTSGKLRLLFVGGLSQRKGLSYLFDAVAQMGSSCELTVIGRKPAAVCAALEKALGGHRWIDSLPHERILLEMRRHDVLIFPSLFEGFGLVILEAMAQGLPVIATPHTAGPDVITDGEDGFLVPIRNSAAIAEKLELLLKDAPRLRAMKEAARQKARRRTWDGYRKRLAAHAQAILQGHVHAS